MWGQGVLLPAPSIIKRGPFHYALKRSIMEIWAGTRISSLCLRILVMPLCALHPSSHLGIHSSIIHPCLYPSTLHSSFITHSPHSFIHHPSSQPALMAHSPFISPRPLFPLAEENGAPVLCRIVLCPRSCKVVQDQSPGSLGSVQDADWRFDAQAGSQAWAEDWVAPSPITTPSSSGS